MLCNSLRERVIDGEVKWAATKVGLIVPRQNGKGSILEARELAGLFLLGEKLITHTAHRFDTAIEHFRRMRELIENTPDLNNKVEHIRTANGDESIELKRRYGGGRLIFKARAKEGGRGFSGDCIVLDEAFWIKDLGAMVPTLSARRNPQLWLTSSAPLPRQESDTLRSLIKEGRALAREHRGNGGLAPAA